MKHLKSAYRKLFLRAGKINLIRQFGQLESEEYTEDGIKVLAYVPKEIEGKL